MFHHRWPLSAEDWDSHLLFFLSQGYRVIGHDRRGVGRSDQTDIPQAAARTSAMLRKPGPAESPRPC
jgi:pimeloyl-ACP methyl ester carboxylesterase